MTLPYPVSANRYWRSFVPRGHQRAIVTVSDEAKAWKSECGWRAKAAGLGSVTLRPVELHITLVPKNRTVMDLDNCLKVSIDALKGIVYADDKQVRKLTAEYGAADGKGQLIVRIRRFDAPAGSLI